MTDRRQFLGGLAALPLHAAAGHPNRATATAESPVPCPEPTPGSVNDPRGSVGKTPLTDLVDAYSQVTGVDWQHQLYSTLSNKPGVCTRYRQNQAVVNEKWLIVIQTAYRSDMQPAPFAPGTYGIDVGTTGPDGTLRTVDATFQPFGRTAPRRPEKATAARSLHGRQRHLGRHLRPCSSGAGFRALHGPMCMVCGPRPSSRTCRKQ